MQIFEFQFKLKPDADENEMLRLFKELAFPIYHQIPGCLSLNLVKYTATTLSGGTPEWDCAFVEVWESDETHRRALSDKYIGLEDSQLANTGFYCKFTV